jgi:hypothetical protein
MNFSSKESEVQMNLNGFFAHLLNLSFAITITITITVSLLCFRLGYVPKSDVVVYELHRGDGRRQ